MGNTASISVLRFCGKPESIGDDGSRVIVNDGDFYGDELLTWCIENAAV